jgi:hypothetical protein
VDRMLGGEEGKGKLLSFQTTVIKIKYGGARL